MYVPPHNRESDPAVLLAFMRAYSFATLVTSQHDALTATHLPFAIEQAGEQVTLVTHMSRANPQWQALDPAREVLVIFQEPHAYVSPSHYERPMSVPTWNYIAIHAYGSPRILPDPEAKQRALTQIMATYEAGFIAQWQSYPPEFQQAKLKGIVAFEIPITRLDARFKLSQDRTPTERATISAHLEASPDSAQATIGTMMSEMVREGD